MLGAVFWVAGKHRLTPSAMLLIAPMLWAMLVALPQLIPGRWRITRVARWTVAAVLAGLTLQMVNYRLAYHRDHTRPSDQIVNFIESVPERFPPTHAVRFSNSSHLTIVRYLTGHGLFAIAEIDEGCSTTRCINVDGRLWMVDPKEGYDRDSILVLRRSKTLPPLPPSCTIAPADPALPRFAVCEGQSTPLEADSGATNPSDSEEKNQMKSSP